MMNEIVRNTMHTLSTAEMTRN